MSFGNWKRPEELIEISRSRTLTSDELLMLKSRSFYGPIMLLEEMCGPNEHNKRSYVRNAYNNLRKVDEIEDCALPAEQKIEMLNRYGFLLGEVVRREEGQNIDDLIDGELKLISKKLHDGIREDDEEAKVFAEHFGRGDVLRELRGFDRDVRDSIDYVVKSMIDGMTTFLKYGEIKTADQLESYCHQVAGRVGGFLHKLTLSKDGLREDIPGLAIENAERLGKYLQLVNILKGIHKDHKEGRSFIPSDFIPGDITRHYMMNEKWDNAVAARAHVFNKMVELAKRYRDSATFYVLAIPAALSGYRSFCLVPLLAADATLKLMEEQKAEKVFAGEESAIKIQGGIKPVMEKAHELSKKSTEEVKNYLLKAY